MCCTLAQLGLFLLDMHSHLLKFKSLGTSTSTSRGGSHVQDHMPPQICSARLTSCYPHIHRGRALVHARSRNQLPLSTTISTANNRGRYIWNSLHACIHCCDWKVTHLPAPHPSSRTHACTAVTGKSRACLLPIITHSRIQKKRL